MKAKDREPVFAQLVSWVVTFGVPVVLVVAAVRILFNPLFLPFEYRLPGFPADSYGFTTQERVQWGKLAMDYLVNSSGVEFLGDLQFADGSPVYNQRELDHMLDVKVVVQGTLKVGLATLALLVVLGLWAWGSGWVRSFRKGLRRGGWLTVILLGSVLLFSLLAFGVFFTAFHNIFFDPDTWRFLWSDTLIRLFPQRFWQDIMIYIAGITLAGGLLLGKCVKV